MLFEHLGLLLVQQVGLPQGQLSHKVTGFMHVSFIQSHTGLKSLQKGKNHPPVKIPDPLSILIGLLPLFTYLVPSMEPIVPKSAKSEKLSLIA